MMRYIANLEASLTHNQNSIPGAKRRLSDQVFVNPTSVTETLYRNTRLEIHSWLSSDEEFLFPFVKDKLRYSSNHSDCTNTQLYSIYNNTSQKF